MTPADRLFFLDRLMRARRGNWITLRSAMWVSDCGGGVRLEDLISFCGWLSKFANDGDSDMSTGMPIETWDDVHEFFSLIEGAHDRWVFCTGYNIVSFISQRFDASLDPREICPEFYTVGAPE